MTKLNVQKRDVNGSLNHLRSEGLTAGVCYGSGFENTPVSFNEADFRKVYREAGTSSVITLGGDLENEQCFIHDMQVHVTSGDVLHVDFKIVAVGEKTEVAVPIETEGEAPAVTSHKGLLRVAHNEINVEAIPSEIPSEFLVDISGLKEVGDSIKVSDLKLPKGVVVLDDHNMTLVTISSLQEDDKESSGPTMEEVLANPTEDADTEEK
jgi:large subunit ribosomal protein L25